MLRVFGPRSQLDPLPTEKAGIGNGSCSDKKNRCIPFRPKTKQYALAMDPVMFMVRVFSFSTPRSHFGRHRCRRTWRETNLFCCWSWATVVCRCMLWRVHCSTRCSRPNRYWRRLSRLTRADSYSNTVSTMQHGLVAFSLRPTLTTFAVHHGHSAVARALKWQAYLWLFVMVIKTRIVYTSRRPCFWSSCALSWEGVVRVWSVSRGCVGRLLRGWCVRVLGPSPAVSSPPATTRRHPPIHSCRVRRHQTALGLLFALYDRNTITHQSSPIFHTSIQFSSRHHHV